MFSLLEIDRACKKDDSPLHESFKVRRIFRESKISFEFFSIKVSSMQMIVVTRCVPDDSPLAKHAQSFIQITREKQMEREKVKRANVSSSSIYYHFSVSSRVHKRVVPS